MNFEEFWKRQQYTDDANDKEFAREAQATAEAIEKTIMQRSNA